MALAEREGRLFSKARPAARLFPWPLWGFVIGVGIGSADRFPPALPWGLLAAGISLFAGRRGWRSFATALFLWSAALGIRHAAGTIVFWKGMGQEGLPVSGMATVWREPEKSERSLKAVLRFTRCDGACPEVLALGLFPAYETLRFGDALMVKCALHLPEGEGSGFDYRMSLAKDGVGYLCRPEAWSRADQSGGVSRISMAVFAVRRTFEGWIGRVLVGAEAALAQGLLLGGDGRLTEETRERFSRTGLSHIVAVSGSNVALVIEAFSVAALAAGFRRKASFWLVASGVGVFVYMAGASASALRAGLAGILALWAVRCGRGSSGLRLWLVVGAGMLAWNPLLLRYDIGFQLSFAATAGILLTLPFFRRIRLGSGALGTWLGDTVFMTMAAEAFVAPLVLYHFHTFSAVSLAANFFVLPLVPFAMFFSFAAALSVPVSSVLARVAGGLASAVLRFVLSVVDALGSLEWSSIGVEGFRGVHLAVWYVALLVSVLLARRRQTERFRRASSCCG
jgi:ComEC/Rec2-related protein